MSLNKKINNDDFINLDYNRIKDEVQDNLNIKSTFTRKYSNKYFKLGIVCILTVILGLLSIVTINSFSVDEKKYLRVSAEEKREVKYEEYTNERYKEFLSKLNKFSFELNESINKKYGSNKDNYVISPVSIYMALAMVVESGDEVTRNEVLDALGMSYEQVRDYTSILYSKLNDIYEVDGPLSDIIDSQVTIMEERMSNSIWIDDTILLKEEGLNNLSKYYNCDSYSVPFMNNNKKANLAVKEYMSDKTKGLIKENLKISNQTLFALMNTYYLKDVWDMFGKELPYAKGEHYFNELIKTKLLQGNYFLGKVYETESYRHYYTEAEGGTKVKFIIPQDGYTINDINTLQVLNEVNNITDYNAIDEVNKLEYYTRCLFPEFEADFKKDIKSILQKDFNINRIFDFNYSLTNITDELVKCDAVYHIAKLRVDKIGIEGAAVTVMPMAGAAGPMYTKVYEEFIVNKSFVVIITDRDNVPLFTGVINNI